MIKDCKISYSVKDIDSKQGIVTGYLSVFDNIDKHDDVIVKGAYKNTLKQKFESNNIKYAYQHDITSLVGKFKELHEDNTGLYFVGQLSKSSLGQDVLIQYEEGILDQHSVGIRVMKNGWEKQKRNGKDITILKELELIEGSVVSLAANPEARLINVKSEQGYIEYMDNINALLKRGDLSDYTLQKLEESLKITNNLIGIAQSTHEDVSQKKSKDSEYYKKLFLKVKNNHE